MHAKARAPSLPVAYVRRRLREKEKKKGKREKEKN